MANANSGLGSTFTWNANPVSSLKEINGFDVSADVIDVTTHDSPDGFKEFIQGLKDAGEISMSGFFYPGDTNGQKAMYSDYETGTVRQCVIGLPTALGTTWTANGFVTKINIGAPMADGVPFSATVKLTGKPTLSITASNNLSGLVVTGTDSVMAPTFAAGTYDYVVTVATAETGVTVTPTAAAGVITVISGSASQVVSTGVPSSEIALGAAGSITTIYVDVQETSKVKKRYTIRVVRPAS